MRRLILTVISAILILGALAAASYILIPLFHASATASPCQQQVTQTFTGEPITASAQGVTVMAEYTATVSLRRTAPCGPARISALVTCITGGCGPFVFTLRLVPYAYNRTAQSPLAPVQRTIAKMQHDQMLTLAMPWTTVDTSQFQAEATVDGWAHYATVAANGSNPLP